MVDLNNYQLEHYVGARAKIGVVIPSTNTAVEYDLQRLALPGVLFHPGRFYVQSPALDSDEAFLKFLGLIRETIPMAVRDLMTCFPTHIMMGMSAETFWGGVEGNQEFLKRIQDQIGDLGLTTGANAMVEALTKLKVKNIAVLTPYQPVGDEQVRGFFNGSGFPVKRIVGLKCATATSIAETPRKAVIDAVKELDGDDVDAIVQVGTNLSTVDLFPVIEQYLGKPVIPINVATVWRALRASGVNDQIQGYGRLLAEF